MEETKFTPKQWVLVRDTNNEMWRLNIFSNFKKTALAECYYCVGGWYKQCIPYEGNESLRGTTDEYKEPWTPKDGDFVVSGWENNGCKCQWIAIVKGRYEDNSYATYYGLYTINNGSDKRGSWFDEYCDSQCYTRNATEEEKQLLLDRMHETGKDWDAENKKVVDWEWEPEIGKDYYFPKYYATDGFFPLSVKWNDDNTDHKIKQRGHACRTKEECQELCDKLNAAIQNVK